MTVEIVILAMIAAFLGLRLYSVLGKRADHGEEPMQSRFDMPQGGIGAPPPVRAPERTGERTGERVAAAGAPAQSRPVPAMLPSVDRALRDIAAADRRFDPASFVEGARAAYRMILEAFWRGDADELAHLCEPAVAHSFVTAIEARHAAGEIIENRLVRINEATITEAGFAAPHARVTMRFVADIAAVTRDSTGHVIAGSLDDAVEVRDVWTFTRDVTSAEPDWVLDETDEG